MKKVVLLVGASVVAMAVASSAAGQNLVANGSFEGPNGLTGWLIGGTASDGYLPVAINYNQVSGYPTGAQGESVPTDNAPSASPDAAGQKGVYFVSDTAVNLSVYQNVYLTPGTYQVGFDAYNTFNGAGEPNDANLTAEIAGVQVANYSLSSVSAGIWNTYSGTAQITTAGYYPVEFVFNPVAFPAKDVVIDRAYIIASSGGGGVAVAPVTRLYWDGDTIGNANNNQVDGGVGVWTTTSPNFTDQTGATNGAYYPQPGSVIFTGSPGVVTVDDTGGAVAVTGMQFAIDGYHIIGDAITLSGTSAIIQVGDGTAAGAGYTATIASALTGTAGLTKTDLGTLILSGANTYTGATVINGGTLTAGAVNTFSATSPITVNAGGTLDLGGYSETVNTVTLNGGAILSSATCNGCTTVPYGELNNTALTSTGGTFAAGLVGTSSLTIQSGVTVFSESAVSQAVGSNDTNYTGPTTISGGTLKGGSAYAFSTATDVTVASGATFDLGGYSQLIGSLSGAGTVTSTGNGSPYAVILDLYDTNSPNFNGTTFSGQIKDGDSPVALALGSSSQPFTLTLSGTNNTFSGGVTWGDNQTISIDNAHAIGVGSLNMYPGSTLAFTGTGYSLANNIVFQQFGGDPTIDTGSGAITLIGVISENQGPGKLDKVGSGTLTLDNVETYTGGTEIHAGTLVVGDAATPTAQLSTGLVQVDAGATLGGYGVIGGDVTNNGTLNNNNNFAPLGLTINGNYIQGSGGNLIIGVTPTAATLLKIGGTANLGGTVSFAYAPGTYHAAVLKFLGAAGGVTGTFSTVAASTPTPTGLGISVAYQADEADLVLTSLAPVAPRDGTIFSAQTLSFAELNQDSVTGLLGRTRPDGGGNSFYNLTPEGGPETRGWVHALGNFIDASESGSSTSLHSASAGLEAGADVALPVQARLGFALGYETGWFTDGDGGSASEDVFRASLYGSKTVGPIGLSGVLSYAHGWDKTNRATGLGFANASRGSNEFSGAVQASAPIALKDAVFTPAVGVQVSSVETGRFVEAGDSDFAVSGAKSSVTTASPFAVLGLSRVLTTSSGVTITPDAEFGYRYDGAANGGRVTLASADGTVFTGNRYELARSGALLGASLNAHSGQLSAFAKYRATVSSHWTDQHVEAGFRYAF